MVLNMPEINTIIELSIMLVCGNTMLPKAIHDLKNDMLYYAHKDCSRRCIHKRRIDNKDIVPIIK